MKIVVAQIGDRLITIPVDMWREHVGIFGKTGMGKSYLLRLIIVQLILHGEGVTLIDPDNDTADDVVAHLVEIANRLSPLRRREITVIQPDPECGVRFDFFDVPEDARYDIVLNHRVEVLMEIMARAHVFRDYDEMRRMKRVVRVVLYLCGTKLNGRHAGLQTAFDWLDFRSNAWRAGYRKVRPRLPRDIANQADHLAKLPLGLLERETESARNLFDSTLSNPLIRAMVTPGPSFDFRKAVRNRHINIWNLGLTEEFTKNQRNVLAGFAFVGMHSACYHERIRHWTVVEEASSVLGHDFSTILRQARKRKEILILCNQDLAGYRDDRTDQRSTVVSQPGIHFCFQVKGPKEELDELAHLFGTRSLNFDLNWKPMDRPDGHQIMQLPERAEAFGQKYGETNTSSETKQRAHKYERSQGTQRSHEVSRAHESGTSQEVTDRRQTTESTDDAKSTGIRRDGDRKISTTDESTTDRSADSFGTDTGSGEHQSVRDGQSERFGGSQQTLEGLLNSIGMTNGRSIENSSQHTTSIAYRNHLVPLYREEWYPNGLLVPIDAQYAQPKTILASLDIAEIICMAGNLPAFKAKVPEISPPFSGRDRARDYLVGAFKDWIRSIHPYYFKPTGTDKCPEMPEYKSRKKTK